jgi:hypothetical protein
MKTNSTSQSAFFHLRVFVGFTLCSAGILLASAELYTSPAGTVNPVPLINQPLVPDAVPPGGAPFTLTVNGTGFVSGSVVNWNGSGRATTFVNSSQLTAAILGSDIATASTASVTVVSPSPGGGTSNEVFFPITSPTSLITLSRSDIPIFTTATGPLDIVTADFNRDGKLDLALANGCCLPNPGHTASVLLGNGDGTFQSQVDYATGRSPTSIITGDFNGDGKLDLAIADFAVAKVSVLLGNGDGTFQAHVDFATGTNPGGITTTDLNGDGKLDLAVANLADNTVSILLGNGDGTFGPHIDYATGAEPNHVATADFNRDGKLDLSVSNSVGASVSILLGNGDGTFQSHVDYAVSSPPGQVATGDLNGDGRLDLAVVSVGSNTVSILLGNGDGTFQGHVDYPVGTVPAGVIMSDFNGDDTLDLVVTNTASNTVSILLGNGDGTFQSHVDYPTATYPQTSSAGDFNGDGRIDLAVVDVFGDAVTILLQATTVALSDTSLRFGLQLVGTHAPAQTVTLTNTGLITLEILSITVSGDFLQMNNCGSSLPPDASCDIQVTFSPTEKNRRAGTLTITDNAVDSPQTVALMGTGTVVQLTPMNVNFGNQTVGTISPPHTVTLTNVGDTPLNIRGIAILGANFGDCVETTTCGSSVPAHTSCEIDVRFAPTATGPREASLRVRDDGGGGAQDVKLSGTGTL